MDKPGVNSDAFTWPIRRWNVRKCQRAVVSGCQNRFYTKPSQLVINRKYRVNGEVLVDVIKISSSTQLMIREYLCIVAPSNTLRQGLYNSKTNVAS